MNTNTNFFPSDWKAPQIGDLKDGESCLIGTNSIIVMDNVPYVDLLSGYLRKYSPDIWESDGMKDIFYNVVLPLYPNADEEELQIHLLSLIYAVPVLSKQDGKYILSVARYWTWTNEFVSKEYRESAMALIESVNLDEERKLKLESFSLQVQPMELERLLQTAVEGDLFQEAAKLRDFQSAWKGASGDRKQLLSLQQEIQSFIATMQ